MKNLQKLTFLLLLVLTTACGNRAAKETVQGDLKTLESSAYSIQYPASWVLSQENANGLAFMLFSPKVSKDDAFIENVNLSIQDLKGQNVSTLEQFTRLSENQVKTMLTDAEILSSEKRNRNGRFYQRMLFQAKQGKFALKYEQYYLIEGTTAYVLTFTAKQDVFETYAGTAEKIMDSFKLKL